MITGRYILRDWDIYRGYDGVFLTGNVYKNEKFPAGSRVRTSRVVKFSTTNTGIIATTQTGSVYVCEWED